MNLARRGIQANHIEMQSLQKEQQAFVEEGRRKQVYQWLAAPDPSINHDAASKKKQEGTGSWLVDSETLSAWRVDPRSFLWIFGIRNHFLSGIPSNLLTSAQLDVERQLFGEK
jgi:hypothetical protein